MTEQASKDIASFPPAFLNSALMRSRQNQVAQAGDKVVSLSLSMADQSQAMPEPRTAATRDWSSALELVQEASEAIRVGEERATHLEEQLAQVLAEAGEEIKRLTLQVADGELKFAQSEQRAALAEARAADAEAWLVKLHDAVVTAFTPVLREGSPDVPVEDKVSKVLPA